MYVRKKLATIKNKLKNFIKKILTKLVNLFMMKKIIPHPMRKSYDIVFKTLKKDRQLNKTKSRDTLTQIAQSFMLNNKPPALAFNEIAAFLMNSGHPEVGKIYYEHSLKLSLSPVTYSLYLQCLMLCPSCDEEQMHKIASHYDELFLKHIKRYEHYDNELSTERKLNIGHICHFFHNGVSKSLLTPYLKAHNRKRVNIFCYSDAQASEVSADIREIADVWRDTKDLSDDALAELIRKDKIDILIELNGHCVVNRYLTIARKPAPIQVSFYNIATTTGISAIDYVMIGDEMSVSKVDSYYTETVQYFKGVCGVAQFPDTFPDVTLDPPCLTNHFVTFGSFGGAQKVNKDVIRLWCKVLKRVPNSRLYMKAGVLTFEPYIKSYQQLFAAEGIDLNRITFEGFSEHIEMLKCYAKVDIALDTFPHAAGTTTMEATWQGVPVLSLYGDRHCMQHGKAILGSVGHPELICYTQEEFVEKAAQLAANSDQLIKYRKELRDDFKKSPRADIHAFASTLEDAYFDMWKKYCLSLA